MQTVSKGWLLSVLILGFAGAVYAEENLSTHVEGPQEVERRKLILQNPANRFNEALNACLLGRPVPDRKPPTLLIEEPAPKQRVGSTEGGGNSAGSGSAASGNASGSAARPPAGGAERPPAAADDKATIALLRSALSKCTPCHTSKFTAGNSLKDTTFEFTDATRSGDPGLKMAKGILGALANQPAMKGVNAQLTAQEKAALAAWQTAQN